MLTERKGQETVVLVSVALMAAFLAGAVAFNQVRLLPNQFEVRTNDLDPMTRAETRGKITAANFIPQAAWYDVNQITYDLGLRHGVGDDVSGYDYEGRYGSNTPIKYLGREYFERVEQRLEDEFDGYSDNDVYDYKKCRVHIDSNIDVEYSTDNPNPIISSADGDGLVKVRCNANGLNITYKSDQSEYELNMGNNRFPIFVQMIATGAMKAQDRGILGREEEIPGVEERADTLESDGRFERTGALNRNVEGYWNDDITAGNGCTLTPMSSKSNAEEQAEEDVQDKIDKQINDIKGEIRSAGDQAMDEAEPESKICFPYGPCTGLPGNLNWEDIDHDATIHSSDKEQEIEVSSSKCGCEEEDDNGNCVDHTWEATAEGKYYLDEITILLEVMEGRDRDWLDENPAASTNEILVDEEPKDGELERITLEVEEEIKHDFDEPDDYD